MSDYKIENGELDYFVAGCGCFWGVQYWFSKLEGVVETIVGYAGGETVNPTYEQVCSGKTGHYEVIKVIFNSKLVKYEDLVMLFFCIHDFEQIDGQGGDIGSQYKSVVFYKNEGEKNTIDEVIKQLVIKKFNPVTSVLATKPFYRAELYHQNYYLNNGQQPYCHFYKDVFKV